jgi:hypothetical protein
LYGARIVIGVVDKFALPKLRKGADVIELPQRAA